VRVSPLSQGTPEQAAQPPKRLSLGFLRQGLLDANEGNEPELPVLFAAVAWSAGRPLADLREIVQQNGTRIAGDEMPYRIAYKDT
jgi:hypothetical protein